MWCFPHVTSINHIFNPREGSCLRLSQPHTQAFATLKAKAKLLHRYCATHPKNEKGRVQNFLQKQ